MPQPGNSEGSPFHFAAHLPRPGRGPPHVPPPSGSPQSPPVSCSRPGQAVPRSPAPEAGEQRSSCSSPPPALPPGADTPRRALGQIPEYGSQECPQRSQVGWGHDRWQALRPPRGSELSGSCSRSAARMPLKRERRGKPRRETSARARSMQLSRGRQRHCSRQSELRGLPWMKHLLTARTVRGFPCTAAFNPHNLCVTIFYSSAD